MGDQKINVASKGKERIQFLEHLLSDIESLELMLDKQMIETAPIRIGSEQEFCIVDNDWTPSKKALDVLEVLQDSHFTTELALYNLEINLDPIELKDNCFSKMMEQQLLLLKKAEEIADKLENKVLLAGILPTISSRHIEMEYMTPSPRYHVLNQMLRKLRGTDFSLHIMGTDELTIKHESVLFEACNTSFQAHLQIEPKDFVSSYNWSQAIAGPILAIAANSPILLNKELWSETRIALFQQSIDTRVSSHSIRQNEPRVTFGNEWIHDSITDIYKDDISRFQLIISREIEENSLQKVSEGKAPKLEALSLHNGTIYRWNRPCYGVAKGIAHLRIENRYLPAGPSAIDEISNMAFWVGLMTGRPAEFDQIQSKMDFKDAKSNFIKAARYGSQSVLMWMGKRYDAIDLIRNKLLPIARSGLEKAGISSHDIELYLGVVERRLDTQTGAEWQIKNYRTLKKQNDSDHALRLLCKSMHNYQKQNIPVCDWDDILHTREMAPGIKPKFVYEIMKTQLFTVNEDDSAELVAKMMSWKNIHHVPVENDEMNIVGLLTSKIIEEELKSQDKSLIAVKDIMIKNVLTVSKNEKIEHIEELMIRNGIGCTPVTKNDKLIGIVTKMDLPK